MTFTEYKKQCPECKEWYGRRYYASMQIEPPANFKRRTTCGKSECIKLQRRKKIAAKKKVLPKAIEAIDLFIYRRTA